MKLEKAINETSELFTEEESHLLHKLLNRLKETSGMGEMGTIVAVKNFEKELEHCN